MQNQKNRILWLEWVITLAGGFAALVGAIALTGWHTHNTTLIQMHPVLPPVQYNTALGFLLCGTGFFSFAFRWPRVGVICGGVIAVIGMSTLAEYVWGINLGVDQLLQKDYIAPTSAHPGRIAPNTALCFTFAGFSLLLVHGISRFPHRPILLVLLGTAIIALSTVASFGYLTGITSAYNWGYVRGMAFQSAFCLLIFGASLLLIAWAESPARVSGVPTWLPVSIGIGGLAIVLLLWQALRSQEHLQIQRANKIQIANIKRQMEEEMRDRILPIGRMANRWAWKQPERLEWESDAGLLMQQQDEYKTISWMDSSLRLQWVTGAGKSDDRLFHLELDEYGKAALASALKEREVRLVRSFETQGRERWLLICAPIFSRDHFGGFILARVQISRLLSRLLDQDMAPGYVITILEGTDRIHVRGQSNILLQQEWEQIARVTVYGLEWQVRVYPEAELLEQEKSVLPEIVLFSGFFVALLLALAVYFAQTARLHAEKTDAANQLLSVEIVERKRVEEELRKARDFLEKRVVERTAEISRANTQLEKEISDHKLTEQALRKSEVNNRAMLDAIPDLILRIGRNGVCLDLRGARDFDPPASADDFSGRNISEILPQPVAEELVGHVLQVLGSGKLLVVECQFPQAGTLRDFEAHVVPIENEEALVMLRDITERKLKDILATIEGEQQRIGRDLHDGLGQHLTGIACMTKVLKEKLADRSVAEAKDMEMLLRNVNQAINQIRGLSRGLYPVELESHGLAFALQELASNAETLFGITCVAACDESIRMHDNAAATHLYRIAQEAISNAVKHGKAGRIEITLASANEIITLSIRDDGVGFPRIPGARKGMGLHIMNYRARIIGASLSFQRNDAVGTTVVCSLKTSPDAHRVSQRG